MLKQEFIFVSTNEVKGISKTTGNPYELRKIKLADPATFENHVLNFQENTRFNGVNKGDRVTLDLELVPGFAGRDSNIVVTAVNPVSVLR